MNGLADMNFGILRLEISLIQVWCSWFGMYNRCRTEDVKSLLSPSSNQPNYVRSLRKVLFPLTTPSRVGKGFVATSSVALFGRRQISLP